MKRSDWISNTHLVKPGDKVASADWSQIADDISKELFEITRFTKVCKAKKQDVRLMLGALFYDASAHGLANPPRPQVIYNVLGLVEAFDPKSVKLKISTIDTALVYEFTYKNGKLTRKQIR